MTRPLLSSATISSMPPRRQIGDQRPEAILDGAVNDGVLARAARGGVERLREDRVTSELGDAVDPLVRVDLEHLLGRVLRAIEPLPLQHRQLLHGGAGRDQRERPGHGGDEGDQDEPDLREEHLLRRFFFGFFFGLFLARAPRPSRSALPSSRLRPPARRPTVRGPRPSGAPCRRGRRRSRRSPFHPPSRRTASRR